MTTEDIQGWVRGRLPEQWYAGAPDVTVDREEIRVVGALADAAAADAGEAEQDGRIARFREDTRDARIQIAREAEDRFGRTIAWGASAGGATRLFTTTSVPVMTRLRQPERIVLDTLVEAGVARSRSDALAWCVRLVGRNTDEWLGQLREALQQVRDVRGQGPTAAAG